MEQFARYAGGWSAYYGGYPYASLNWACWRMKVQHDGKIDVWEPPPKTEEIMIDDSLGDLSDHPF